MKKLLVFVVVVIITICTTACSGDDSSVIKENSMQTTSSRMTPTTSASTHTVNSQVTINDEIFINMFDNLELWVNNPCLDTVRNCIPRDLFETIIDCVGEEKLDYIISQSFNKRDGEFKFGEILSCEEKDDEQEYESELSMGFESILGESVSITVEDVYRVDVEQIYTVNNIDDIDSDSENYAVVNGMLCYPRVMVDLLKAISTYK